MITLTREEAQQVLDALNSCGEDWIADGEWETQVDDYDHELVAKALETLRARLSAPEPEPVACKQCGAKGIHACVGYRWEEGRTPPSVTFTAPPQPEPEPVAWLKKDRSSIEVSIMSAEYMKNAGFEPLYTALPQREWQGLTDEEVENEVARILVTLTEDIWPIALSRAIEAKLKEKNT